MRAAWEEVSSNKGAPGVDGVSIKHWRRKWEENLYNLTGSVWANTYKPSPPKYFYIPKKSGGRRKISILTVRDRVLQRAVLRIVDDFFEISFLDCSYGYRQGRGLRDAVARIIELRDNGYQWVLDADIDDCFNQLDHQLIKNFFRQTVSDPILNRLVSQWLEAGVKSKEDQVGISMGGVISPLFCNLVLHQLDRAVVLEGWEMVRYADDFCVFARSEGEIREVYQLVEKQLRQLNLRYEPHKTRITTFESGFVFLGVTFVGDQYSFDSNLKHIIVQGAFDDALFVDYHPKGYA
jgi:group II intron reverse transcriptase/maturase